VSPSGLILGTAYDIRQTRKAPKREEFPFVARRQQWMTIIILRAWLPCLRAQSGRLVAALATESQPKCSLIIGPKRLYLLRFSL
jgi:hypothetical protein